MTRLSQKTIDQLVEKDLKDLNKISKEEQQRNETQVKRLQKLYPLFTFDLQGKVLTVNFSKTHSFAPWIKNGILDLDVIQTLNHEHMILSLNKSLMTLYPNLFISCYPSSNGINLTVWINRLYEDGTPNGHEAVGSICDITDINLHPTLFEWEIEAKLAKQDNWFFCTGHEKAEPKSKYGYFYFAGNYCKQWGDEHPEQRMNAARETYE